MEAKEFNPRIILLVGYARAGKDTVADNIVQLHDDVELICFTQKFAEPLYQMMHSMFVETGAFEDGEFDKNEYVPFAPNQVTFRKALQTLGTEWGRDVLGDNLWANLLCARISNLPNAFPGIVELGCTIVVSDCRFVNEATTLREAFSNVEIWSVVRDQSEPQLQHRSEQEIETLFTMSDVVIDNNGSYDELETRVQNALGIDK
jgi:hypothetical protein